MEATELIVTPEERAPLEAEVMEETENELREYLRALQGSQKRRPSPPMLVFEDGRQLELPTRVLETLQFVLHHMAHGDAISLVPMNKMLTTNQAAEILNVSRPFLVKLLNERAIKFTKVGTHHRLRMADVLQYKERRDREVLEALNELANEAQEAGNYFDE